MTTFASETILSTTQPESYFVVRPSRDEAIERIKNALKSRSGEVWSVKAGRGTSRGWLTIASPAKRQNELGYMSQEDIAELKSLLGLNVVHQQGVLVAASGKHYQEYVDRAEGRTPSVIGEQYWD